MSFVKTTPEARKKEAKPNILITGTPGVGKTSLAENVAVRSKMKRIDIAAAVKENQLHEGWDEEHESYILDEDKLIDYLEESLHQGNCIVDYHASDLFPERWFDKVVILRTETEVLYDRLKERKYAEGKIQENVTAEIMQVVHDEAFDSYDESIISVMPSNSTEEFEKNTENLSKWIEDYRIVSKPE